MLEGMVLAGERDGEAAALELVGCGTARGRSPRRQRDCRPPRRRTFPQNLPIALLGLGWIGLGIALWNSAGQRGAATDAVARH
jgi:hypothetical protein